MADLIERIYRRTLLSRYALIGFSGLVGGLAVGNAIVAGLDDRTAIAAVNAFLAGVCLMSIAYQIIAPFRAQDLTMEQEELVRKRTREIMREVVADAKRQGYLPDEVSIEFPPDRTH